MHKNVQTNPEKSHNTPIVYVDTRKNFKAIRGNGYRFIPKGGTFPIENHHACCEKLWFVRSLYPNPPQMGQFFYHGTLMLLHDTMPSFMNFRRVLDLLEFKYQVSHCFAGKSTVPWCFKFIPIACMGPKHAPRDTDLIFQ